MKIIKGEFEELLEQAPTIHLTYKKYNRSEK